MENIDQINFELQEAVKADKTPIEALKTVHSVLNLWERAGQTGKYKNLLQYIEGAIKSTQL